ncbi:MAG TPA: peptidyl-prolyl cis-trans isomerase [Bryobacteraceae bacterium]|jgi:peptidyl-prolyl cis-trans isomerase D|nr:peptidyl-prolyl cis-trans isomerase [Bryobacteraceae bacterium]
MFDLFRSRDKAVRILLGGLLVVVAFSMLTYLVPSYNTGANSSDVVVAEIGNEALTLPEVQRQIQNTVKGRQLPPEILPNFIPQIVDQMVTERALAWEAERLGFEVTDAQVADGIRQMIPSLFPDGKFVGRDMYAGFLAQQNLSIGEFEADMKRQLLMTRMRDVALEGTIVSPSEIEQEYRKRNEKAKIQYVKVPSDKYRAEVQPTPQEMQDYFKANKASYMTPEKRNLSVLIADQAKLEANVNPADAELRRTYGQNQEKYRVPDRVKIRQILLKTQGKSAAEDAQVKAKADGLLKQIKAGADFAELAKNNSEDPSSAANGGAMPDWLTHGQFSSPDFDKAAFSLKPGQTSDLVKVDYGYHIIQVLEKEDGRLKPFDEVKGELASQYKKERASDMMQKISDKAQAQLQKDPLHPEKVAADLNMELVQANDVEPGKPIPGVGPGPELEQAVSTLKKGEVSQPVALAANKLAIAVVLDVIPPRPSTFEEVQTKVKDSIIENRLTVAVQKHAADLVAKTNSMGGDLDKAAKSLGLEIKTSDEFARTGNVEGLGPASYVSDAFTRPDGTILGPLNSAGTTFVAKVLSHAQPDMSKLPEQRVQIRDEIKGQKGRDRNTLFDAGLKDTLVKQGKIKYHNDVISRLLASYRPS